MTKPVPDDEPENDDSAVQQDDQPTEDGDGLFGVFGPEPARSSHEEASGDTRTGCGDLFSLPMTDFLKVVIARCQGLPDTGTWRSPMFEFTRYLKARKDFVGWDALNVAERVESDLRRLTPEDEDPWQYHFGDMGADDARAEFVDTWPKIRTPADMDALQAAARLAERRPLQPQRVYSPKYCHLISIAGHLQRSCGDKPIALPVERLAELLGCNRRSVGTYLKFAMKENILRKVTECVPHNRAAEFIFSVDRFDWSTGRQIK